MIDTYGLSIKKFPSVVLYNIIIIANNTIQVTSTKRIKVNQKATLVSNSGIQLNVIIHKVLTHDTLYVVDEQNPGKILNLLPFNNGTLYIIPDDRGYFGEGQILRAVYDEEPTVAFRNILVDWLGNYIDYTNPLPVSNILSPNLQYNPYILNININNIPTAVNIPNNTVFLNIKTATSYKIVLSLEEEFNTYITIFPGSYWLLQNILLKNTTFYLKTTTPNPINVEIFGITMNT